MRDCFWKFLEWRSWKDFEFSLYFNNEKSFQFLPFHWFPALPLHFLTFLQSFLFHHFLQFVSEIDKPYLIFLLFCFIISDVSTIFVSLHTPPTNLYISILIKYENILFVCFLRITWFFAILGNEYQSLKSNSFDFSFRYSCLLCVCHKFSTRRL